ncbi:DUF4235 domain-containing protein [Arcanobacterium haemolyticum]|nr:DUF4235 domain-containing protein [Arcanobacterium haemolyticum]
MDIGWKIVSAGAGIVSGIIANKLVDVAWKLTFKRDSPNAEDVTEPMRDAIVFAVVSASVGAVVNQLVMRKTAKWYGMDKVIADMANDLTEAHEKAQQVSQDSRK